MPKRKCVQCKGEATGCEHCQLERLSGKLKHMCPDWDFMAIDETTPEFDCCTCEVKNVETN